MVSEAALGTSSTTSRESMKMKNESEAALRTVVDMNEQELSLLAFAFQEDADTLKEGLFDFQEEALNALRAGAEFLSEKYPGSSFEMSVFTPATVFHQESSCTFIEGSGNEDTSMADEEYLLTIIYDAEKGEYRCADNFYGAVLRERYDEAVGQCLETVGISSKEYTTFSVPMGKEMDGTLSVEEFLSMEPPVTRMTSIFLSVPEDPDLISSLEDILTENRFYGSYYVHFDANLENQSVASLQENRKSMTRRFFSCLAVRTGEPFTDTEGGH